jgi:glycosyltransferase involved in cell wall biosynthesis
MNLSDVAVSVIIPTHDRASLIARSIRSALEQTLQDLEILVIDDASTDDTAAVVAAFGDPRIRYLRHETNQGACVARNTGIRAARGAYVAFLDSDEEWVPHKLAVQVEALERSDLPEAGIVTCGEMGVNRAGRSRRWLPARRGWVFEALLLQQKIGCRTSSLLVKRSVLEKHGILFDPALPARQDWDFVARVARVAQLEIVREPLVVVHHHDGERVWTPARAVRAGQYLHDKFQAELVQRARSHSRFHLRIALSCLAAGDNREARRQVLEALAADRADLVSYPGLALTYLDAGTLPRLQRLGMKMIQRVIV